MNPKFSKLKLLVKSENFYLAISVGNPVLDAIKLVTESVYYSQLYMEQHLD